MRGARQVKARRRSWPGALLIVAVAAACGADPAASPPEAPAAPATQTEAATEAAPGAASDAAAHPGQTAAGTIEAVYAELAGLEGEERREALSALAMAEQDAGHDFFLYTPLDPEELEPILAGFEETTGLDAPELYQASASSLRERLITESTAGRLGGDVITGNSTEMLILSSEGIFAPLESPLIDELTRGVYDDWVTIFFSAFIGAWNTERVAEADVPQTWEEILTETDNLAMGGGDFDFMATLVKDHFMAELDMTEEQALEIFRTGACDATFVQGHTLQTQLMAAGEFSYGTSVYHHQVVQGIDEGAPLGWEPPIEPIVLVPNGAAVGRDVDRPASALLFLEHLLQDGQRVFAGVYRTPVDATVEGGVPADYGTLILDEAAQVEEREKWDALYEEFTQCSGRPVRE